MVSNSIQLRFKPDYKKFWNINRMFSYTDIHTYIVVGGRGIGKTTGALTWCVNNFIKRGEEFVLMRRYKTESKKAIGEIDKDFIGIKHVSIGDGVFRLETNKVRIGYVIPMSTQATYKSGIDFSNVTTLIFDEAILPSGGAYRYLENDVEVMFEVMSTIFRARKDYNVFILGNNASLFNPYFEYFHIPRFETNYVDKSRQLYCELAKNSPELLEQEMETPLYKLTQGTSYADYHYNNKPWINSNVKIADKLPTAKLMYRLLYNSVTLNVYRQTYMDLYIEKRDKVIKDNDTWIIMENGERNYMYVREFKKTPSYRLLELCYYDDSVYYDSIESGAILNEIMEAI